MRGVRVQVGHDTGGRVLVRLALLRVPGIGTLWLRARMVPAEARAVADGLTRHAGLAEEPST